MQSIKKSNESIEFNLGVVLIREGENYIANIPALDLCTHGDSEEDAIQAAEEAATAFLDALHEMGTFEDVLMELGWEKDGDDEMPYVPPEVIHAYYSVKVPCHV